MTIIGNEANNHAKTRTEVIMNELMKIKDVSTRFDVTTCSLRYYENMGLIKSTRDESSGYRLYNEALLFV